MPLHLWLYGLFRKYLVCRLGLHGRRTTHDGKPANFCEWGCGHVFNHSALREWRVTLKTGEVFEVKGINEFHAGSQVVYGNDVGRIDGKTGAALGEVKVHRDNIASIVVKLN